MPEVPDTFMPDTFMPDTFMPECAWRRRMPRCWQVVVAIEFGMNIGVVGHVERRSDDVAMSLDPLCGTVPFPP
jgi:hypothetical protein